MTRFAIDTGPLVALLNARDSLHQWSRDTLDSIRPPLSTCESVVSEACFLVRMTELDAELTIITADNDFRIYRRHGRQLVPTLMP